MGHTARRRLAKYKRRKDQAGTGDALRMAREALAKADEAARKGASMAAAGYSVCPEHLGGIIYKITSPVLAALSAGTVGGGEAVAMSCRKCSAPRAVSPCHKCGGPLTPVAEGWDWPETPDIGRVRELAREVGYGVGVHGSLERDMDLIAIPWTADAVSPSALAAHIASGLPGQVLDDKVQDKPCGRWSCNINPEGWFKMIDLSVMPPAALSSPQPSVGREEVARVIVDRTGAGTLGLNRDDSMRAALPIAEEILALLTPAATDGGE